MANINISDFQIKGDSILILSQNNIYLYYNEVLSVLYNSAVPVSNLEYKENFGIVCASTDGTLYLDTQLAGEFLSPNAPPVNQFPSMSVDASSKLWSASGRDGRGVGYYTYDGSTWEIYNTGNTPALPSNDVYHSFTSGNTAYLGTWGSGFFVVNGENKKRFNRGNAGLRRGRLQDGVDGPQEAEVGADAGLDAQAGRVSSGGSRAAFDQTGRPSSVKAAGQA